jgi:hypothetical protein
MNTLLLENPDDPYDSGASLRSKEAEELAAAQAKERENQIDAALEKMLMTKDERTLQEWAVDVLVYEFQIAPDEASQIVADEVAEWHKALIPFNWKHPVSTATHFMKQLAREAAIEQMRKRGKP